MKPDEKHPNDFLSRLVKLAWLLVVLEGVALMVAIYLIWSARADIAGSFHQ